MLSDTVPDHFQYLSWQTEQKEGEQGNRMQKETERSGISVTLIKNREENINFGYWDQ